MPILGYRIVRSGHDRLNSQGRRMEVPRLSRHKNPSYLVLSSLQQYTRSCSTTFHVDYLTVSNHHFYCHYHQQTARRQTHQLHPGSHACNSQFLLHHLVSGLDRACGGISALLLSESCKSISFAFCVQHLHNCSQADGICLQSRVEIIWTASSSLLLLHTHSSLRPCFPFCPARGLWRMFYGSVSGH